MPTSNERKMLSSNEAFKELMANKLHIFKTNIDRDRSVCVNCNSHCGGGFHHLLEFKRYIIEFRK